MRASRRTATSETEPAAINFVIIAWILFLIVKLMNRLLHSEAAKVPPLTKQEQLLAEIRDLLKSERR